MENSQSKQAKTVAANSLTAKVQDLPLLCVEMICKFTQTSKLVQLYSVSVPLPGAFWNFGLEAALAKRGPLSLRDDLPAYHQADHTATFISDAAGSCVASVSRPGAFRFSPLCGLIESAALTVRVTPDKLCLYVVQGELLLANLPNVSDLTLALREPYGSMFLVSKDPVGEMKHLLPQLTSFAIKLSSDASYCWRLHVALADFVRDLPVHEMASLRRLVLPEMALSGIATSTNNSALRRVLSGLNSLGGWQGAVTYSSSERALERSETLRFVPNPCSHVTSLFLLVHGKFTTYLAAFRALPDLLSLGLHLPEKTDLSGLTFTTKTETITSVSDLRISTTHSKPESPSSVFSVASLFPNTDAFTFQSHQTECDALAFLSQFCTNQILPKAHSLRCFSPREVSPAQSPRLVQFLSNLSLPEAVDLSSIIFESLGRDPGLLAAICGEMKTNRVRTLLLRGPVHRDALASVDLSGENVKVTAWQDRDLGEQPGILNLTQLSQQTDLRIVGRKTGGYLQGQEFRIRVFHQCAKRSHIFE